MKIFGIFLVIAWTLLPSSLCGQIQDIGEIQHTPVEDAATGIPVLLEAQVTHFHPRRSGLFIYDGVRGIYVHLEKPAESYEGLRVGSIVKIDGVTSVGAFVPNVTASHVKVLGWRPLEAPRQFHFFEIFVPNFELDCAWLSVWGQLVDVEVLKDFDYMMLEMEVHGLRLSVQVPYSEEALADVRKIMFKRVFVPAVVGTIYNRHRQMTGRTFLVNSVDDFVIIDEEEASVDANIRPIETLMHAGDAYQNVITTRGVVTYADENSIYLRGEKSCLMASTLERTELQPGDYVNLRGVIWVQPISPAFRAREVDVLERREPPVSLGVYLGGDLNPDWCYELIHAEATLVDVGETFGLSRFSAQDDGVRIESSRASLLCRVGDRIFEARLPSGAVLSSDVEPGAKVRLTGICHLVPNMDPRWSHFTEGVWMELRSEDGIKVLRPAPWWTTQRLFVAMTIVLGVSGLFLMWVLMLRKTVAGQTQVIGKQIEEASVQNERQRIARELHDTLEQSLAGATFQLENCSKQLDNDFEKGKESLRLAEGMLRNCREESRNSIVELRGSLLEKMDLPSALEQGLQPLAEERGVALRVTVSGEVRRLKLGASRHVFRIAKEAVSNALNHAAPQQIRVVVCYPPDSISMIITDDGVGFEVDQLTKFERFGLQGMRERANRLNGTLKISSIIGEGTSVRLDLPSTREWESE